MVNSTRLKTARSARWCCPNSTMAPRLLENVVKVTNLEVVKIEFRHLPFLLLSFFLSLYHTSMFLTNQIAQLRVLDFTYTTSRAVSRRRKPPRTLILPTANTYTTRREHLYYLRTVYCCILEKNSLQGLRLYSYYLEA